MQDLVADGGNSVSLTPGAAIQKAEFLVQAPRAGVGDNWPLGLNIVKRVTTTLDQPASGASAVNWDMLAAVVDSFNVQSPILGNTHAKDTYTGPIAKHLIEFVSSGYGYGDGARIQIPTTDQDNTVDLYFVLPFAHECFERPHHFGVWLGWLKDTEVTTYLAPSTIVAALSTGAVIEAPTTVTAWIEYVVSDELIMPTMNNWKQYQAPAAGGTTAILQGIGTANGYNDVLDGSRIAGIYELTSAGDGTLNLMGGPTTADNYLTVAIPQLSQDVFEFPDAYFRSYRIAMGGGTARGPRSGAATGYVIDRAGNPNKMSATTNTNNKLNSADALYIPWRSVGRNAQITKQPKFFGDLKMLRTFTTKPTSGTYGFVTNELRELGDQKKREMIGKTGRAGVLETIWGGGSKGSADNQRHPKRQACLPERVVFT